MNLAFSPDGTLLAGSEWREAIVLWDAATGRERARLKQPSLSVGLGAGLLAGRSPTCVRRPLPRAPPVAVRVWEVASGTVRQEFTAHQGIVRSLDFSPDGKALATASDDTTVLLWDLTGKAGKTAGSRPSADELDRLWAELDDADARRGFRAMCRLLAAPDDAAALLRERLKPVPGERATPEAIARLLDRLDSDSFDEREKATADLEALGRQAEAAMHKALAAGPSAERKKRIEGLLEKLRVKMPPREMVRPLRAVEVLERLGTPEARKVLEVLAKGRSAEPLTQAAVEALDRLRRQ